MTENIKPSRTEESVAEAVAGEELEQVTPEASKRGPLEPLWGDGRNPDPSRICTARRTNGEACRKVAIKGGKVCATHGGRAPQVKAKARVRLEEAADRMAKELLQIATADDAPAAVKLAAIKDALDRAGLSAKTAVDVQVGPAPEWEQVLTGAVTGGSRAESRAERGVADEKTPDWLAEELEDAQVLDAEVVEAESAPALPAPQPPASARREASPVTGLMTMEDALEQLRATSPPPAPLARRRGRR
ncbi:hypothetical protein [Prescottella equi]|uniref:hypothetical protein n=1 Tax=Rhodococcus hoagii TaxID=43767 RepID=UPI000A10DC40|nr:hypothetical protein [Prescottella equi]ORM06354.1 hypothetical protein A5N72_08820 [Prescottella equi]